MSTPRYPLLYLVCDVDDVKRKQRKNIIFISSSTAVSVALHSGNSNHGTMQEESEEKRSERWGKNPITSTFSREREKVNDEGKKKENFSDLSSFESQLLPLPPSALCLNLFLLISYDFLLLCFSDVRKSKARENPHGKRWCPEKNE